MRCHNVFHISQLLEYKDGGREQAPPPPLDFDDGEGGEWLEIDRVLTHREAKKGRSIVTQYLVRWKGMGPEHDEWRDEIGVSAPATDDTSNVLAVAQRNPHTCRNAQDNDNDNEAALWLVVPVDAVAVADRGVLAKCLTEGQPGGCPLGGGECCVMRHAISLPYR